MAATTNSFEILKCVTRHGAAGISFSGIVQETALPKATVHRLAKELTNLGALIFNADVRTYQGGMLLAHLGSSVTANFDLAKQAKAQLAALQAATGYVATLGMIDGMRGIYLDKVEPKGFGLKLHSEIGREFPLHCTGMGKVLLAFGSATTRKTFLKGVFTRHTENTLTNPADLSAELDRLKAAGYGLDAEEITAGLTCIAAPIFDHKGKLMGAMSCTFPTSLEDKDGMDHLAKRVCSHATAVFG